MTISVVGGGEPGWLGDEGNGGIRFLAWICAWTRGSWVGGFSRWLALNQIAFSLTFPVVRCAG